MIAGCLLPVACCLFSGIALADDRVDSTLTWFQERRGEGGSLTVLHPQVDIGIDIGSSFTLNGGYEADIVSGATPSVYAAPMPGQSVDAVSAASQMDDQRHSGRAGFSMRGKRSTFDVGYTYGTERDYKSHAVTSAASIDLPGKNSNFALSYTHNFDKVCDLNNGDAQPLERRALSGENACFTGDMGANTVTHDVDIDTASATITQNLSPKSVLQLGLYGQIVRGFQSNPYRRVRVSGFDAQESLPLVRSRAALFARVNLAIPSIKGAAGAMLRGYADTWGVQSASLELTYNQYLGSNILFRLRGRYYQQTGAVFFRDAVDYLTQGPPGAYFTGDRELSPLRTIVAGGKLSYLVTGQEGRAVWGLFDEIDFHLKGEGIWSMPLTETPPGLDVEGPIPDAIVAQIALLLRY